MASPRKQGRVVPLQAKDPGGASSGTVPDVAEVDGKRVVIRGHEEVVLQCGEATIILRANGKITIRGVEIESNARGLNRIKGGGVKVN